jgi:pilus assembly protein CpaC
VHDVHASTGTHVSVPVGKSRVVRLSRPFSEVVLAQAAVANVRMLSTRSFYVYGREPGTTNVLLLNSQRQPVAMVDLDVGFDVDGLQQMIDQMLPGEGVRAHGAPNGIILRGAVSSSTAAAQAVAIAQRFAPEGVTNALSVRSPQQVLLEVRFLEAQRSVGRELGLNTFARMGEFSVATGAQAGPDFIGDGLASGATAFGSVRYFHGDRNRNFVDVQLDALEERGVIHMLAEPNLTALSGDTATFLAGGEFPIPVAATDERITIEFKEFGVSLAFTPTVLNDGRINLRVSTEVSQLDSNSGIRIERIQIPSLTVRRSSTTIELADGQSMAMAGLIQSNYFNARTQTPWIADVPVLGALFSSTRFQRAETELVVVVTPRLVAPVNSQAALSAPFSGESVPTDLELFTLGRMERLAPIPTLQDPLTSRRRGGRQAQ